ncbi:MAG: phosphotransferase [Desulfobacterales bacterium]|nr:phosphotransferase [Desulfobacterales bacterium]
MKAMILAAGFGTRLLPYTEDTPKPLFTIAGRPLLDIIIRSLQSAGCEAVIINTHHLPQKIDSFIAGQKYLFPVSTRYEPEILGTGGAIKNASDFWDDRPFMVINSDIVTNIDLGKVYEYHLNHNFPATLVLHDDPDFNTVTADKDSFITGFNPQPTTGNHSLTFTGIQVINPEVISYIPENVFSSSIDAYTKLMAEGKKIKAFISKQYNWKDIGTPERYRNAVISEMAPKAFKISTEQAGQVSSFKFQVSNFQISNIQGDGSDRKWYRLTAHNNSLIMADHGIRTHENTSETDSFVSIGRHLHSKGIPVPEIYLYDTFSGIVFMEDLGDVSLQAVVRNAANDEEIFSYYKSVIDILVQLSVSGGREFDLSWTYQTAHYDRELILERECRYFVDAFLNGYLGMNLQFEDFKDEFELLADKALEFSVNGFMHRDMQSRNIMAVSRPGNEKSFYLIDFQGGRTGPIQYDLASLLIDPYVNLPYSLQADLLDYCIKKLSLLIQINSDRFRECYKYCSLTRNLQMLGAFGYLSRVKGKTYFEEYIPLAVRTLKNNFIDLDSADFSSLKEIID